MFVKDKALPNNKLKQGTEITKDTFTNLKRSQSAINTFHLPKPSNNSNCTCNFNKTLHSNYLYFKLNKENINMPGKIGITVTSKVYNIG